MSATIRIDDLKGPEIKLLLQAHLDDMHATSPPGSVHALDLSKLRAPSVTMWTAWIGGDLAGCGALKQHDTTLGEIKSMRTDARFRGRGIARQVLDVIIQTARDRGLVELKLETGSSDFFQPALNFYHNYGFKRCGPFADYTNDPFSVFMELRL